MGSQSKRAENSHRASEVKGRSGHSTPLRRTVGGFHTEEKPDKDTDLENELPVEYFTFLSPYLQY